METNRLNKAHEQVIAKINALDLAPIKFKLMDTEEGHGWSREYADRIETEYKRFLTLLVKHPEASIAPSKEVDKFWHGHILDTMKYAEDCKNVFDYFLHHFPYFGMRGSEDAANLAAAADTMKRLYRQEFGDQDAATASSYCGVAAGEATHATSKQSSYCGATVASSYCGVVAGKETQAAAEEVSYCGVALGVSYCGVVAEKNAQAVTEDVSYCGVVSAASYCGVATFGSTDTGKPRESILNPSWRPTLPPSVAK